MASPNVLWVTPEPPDRRQGGGSIRQSFLLEALAQATSVDVLLVCDGLDEQCARAVRDVEQLPEPTSPPRPPGIPWFVWAMWENEVLRMPSPVVDTRAHAKLLAPRLRARARDYDLVHFEHDRLAPLGRQPGLGRRTITLHNLRSEQAGHLIAAEDTSRLGRALARRTRRTALAFEQGVLADFDEVFVTSPDDAAALSGRAKVIPNGVDVVSVRSAPLPTDPRIVFTGRLDWQPNVEGLKWFSRLVLPRVRAQVPDVRLDVVGFNPVPDVYELRGDRVEIHPDVPSTVPFLHAGRIAIVPLHVGSGTRLKALEALAAGRPVVGTSVGLAGLGLESGRTAVVADDPETMAAAITRLLLDDHEATAMADAGRRYVEEHFDWRAIGAKFAEAMLAVAGQSGSP
jgi:glycosyltransferase involved in cell wall biosynthesis